MHGSNNIRPYNMVVSCTVILAGTQACYRMAYFYPVGTARQNLAMMLLHGYFSFITCPQPAILCSYRYTVAQTGICLGVDGRIAAGTFGITGRHRTGAGHLRPFSTLAYSFNDLCSLTGAILRLSLRLSISTVTEKAMAK